MHITSSGIKNGYFLDCYGGHGQSFNENAVPTYSIPFRIEQAPNETESFVVVLYDIDAYEVTRGFPWIHWVVANLTREEILENESQTATDFIQGVNSWHSPLKANQSRELSSFYGGMTPPNSDHVYTLQVWALDTILTLENGFYLNQLSTKMKNHILDSAILEGSYRRIDEQ